MDKNNFLVALDNGHGVNTPGKSSPDLSLKEYKWAREMVDLLIREFTKVGIKTYKVVPEENDISLRERCRRVNQMYKTNKNMILISVHCNAAGNDKKWHSANGWSVYIAQNASSNSKHLAKDLYEQAIVEKVQGNRSVPKEKYWVQSLAMCRDTHCPAVLTENMFQDNKEDVDFLLSEEGKEKLARLHVNGVLNYINGK